LTVARRARFHLHFTQTCRSWLNQVERWFALITTQATRRGSVESVADRKRKIDEFVKHYNQRPKPFMRPATVESILAKSEPQSKVIHGTRDWTDSRGSGASAQIGPCQSDSQPTQTAF